MGFLSPVIGAASVYLNYQASPGGVAFWLSLAFSIGALWSYGVMHNYAVRSSQRRGQARKSFTDFDEQDLDAAPNWLAVMNMFCTFAVVIGFIYSLVR